MDEVLFERQGALGVITLNRPRQLNALTLGMIRAMAPQLRSWAEDPEVMAVVIRGAGDRAFCAGGDVRAVWEAGQRGEPLTKDFFREEYSLNRQIRVFPKPYVALIDGITMGGGVGLSAHGSHRVAGERTMVAMPETAIGLFPDVGATYLLSRMPAGVGAYLALTGARLKAADAMDLGLATHYVPGGDEEATLAALVAADWSEGSAEEVVDGVLADLVQSPGPAPLATHRAAIERCFDQGRVEDIMVALEEEAGDWAREQREILKMRSPFSMKLSLRALRNASRLSFEDAMTVEFRLSQACMRQADFFEGIRAVLVDKDHAPVWNPSRLDAVPDQMIEDCFAPLGADDLIFEDERVLAQQSSGAQ